MGLITRLPCIIEDNNSTTQDILGFNKESLKETENILGFKRKSFYENYFLENIKSLTIGCSSYVFTAISLGCTIHEKEFSHSAKAFAVSALVFSHVWFKWGNKACFLAKVAYTAISEKKEVLALKYIEQGAEIFYEFDIAPTIFPFLYSEIKFKGAPNLLLQAIQYDCHKVIRCLTSLGWNLNYSSCVLGNVNSFETAELLIELGAKVNEYTGVQHSVLFIQIRNLKNIAIRKKIDLDDLEKKCTVIEFLLKNDAQLRLPPFEENKNVIKWLKEIIVSLVSVNENIDVTKQYSIVGKVQDLEKKLFTIAN